MRGWLTRVVLLAAWTGPALAQETLPESKALMMALVDEMQRAMKLQMEDLERPYFVQLDVDDSLIYQIRAEYGALTGSDRERSRRLNCQVRVGSAELDNTNFAEGGRGLLGGGRGRGSRSSSLPLDDDYLAIRQAIWGVADSEYKEAVETLTRKRAYLKDKNIADRPNDFSPAKTTEHLGVSAVLDFDRAAWEKTVQEISGFFKKHRQVQSSSVRLIVGAGNTYLVNSEGTRLRYPDARAILTVDVEMQADDGMRLSGTKRYSGASPADFPSKEQMSKDIDALVAELTATLKAETMDRYSGPVLFDDLAAAQLFQSLLAGGLAGRPEAVGSDRRNPFERESLDKKIGTLILPKSFQVWDDPSVDKLNGQVLLGHYAYDDEGVPAERVDLVKDGKLLKLCLSQAPIAQQAGSNGHGRRGAGGGSLRADIGCLFIKCSAGLSEEELKAALIEAAQDAGLEYGVRIKLLSSGSGLGGGDMRRMMRMLSGGGGGGGVTIGSPVVAFKVFVDDGREEPFRGCELGPIRVTELKRIAAAGRQQEVHNVPASGGLGGSSASSTIVAPAVLFPEIELAKSEEEHDHPPILKPPADR